MGEKPYIDIFIKLIYPEMTELAMATLSEEDCVNDAVTLIKEQAERIKELEAELGKCFWTQDEDGIYDTDCDNRFELLAGTPKDNRMKYCPYCGKLID